MKYRIPALLILLTIAACQTKPPSDPLDSLTPGMTAANVKAILGEPSAKGIATRDEWLAKAKATTGMTVTTWTPSVFDESEDFVEKPKATDVWLYGPTPIAGRDSSWTELQFGDDGKLIWVVKVLEEFKGS